MGLFQPDNLSAERPRFVIPGDDAEVGEVSAYTTGVFGAGPASVLVLDAPLGFTRYYRVEHEGRILFVKTSDRPNTFARFQTEARWADALHARGVRVPRVAGPPAEKGGRAFVAFDFVEGEHFSGLGRQLEEASSVFVQLAASAARYQPDRAECEPAPLDHKAILRSVPELWTRGRNDARTRTACANFQPAFEASLADADANFDRLHAEIRRVHVDFHPLNLLFRGDELAAVLDFEDLLVYPFAVASGFAAFKLLRRLAVARGGPVAGAWRTWQRDGEAALLRSGAHLRTLVLLDYVLRRILDEDNDFLLPELEKHSRALGEIDKVFT